MSIKNVKINRHDAVGPDGNRVRVVGGGGEGVGFD